jgi:hypothetical protein
MVCTDINECSASPCHAWATCFNNVGSYTCACNTGYNGSGIGCTDLNECTLNADTCAVHAVCNNNAGSFTCACNTGYTGNGSQCDNINECLAGDDNCNGLATCTDTNGTFTCSCNEGYIGTGHPPAGCINPIACDNETDTGGCNVSASCVLVSNGASPQMFECTCNRGYEGNGVSDCDDIDECGLELIVCSPHATCANTPGSATCACNNGFTGSGLTCEDIDECADDNVRCSSNFYCLNVIGSFFCVCPQGMTGCAMSICDNDDPDCVVPTCPPCEYIDECALDLHFCSHTCTNREDGNYTCSCPTGYTLGANNFTCIEDATEPPPTTAPRSKSNTLAHATVVASVVSVVGVALTVIAVQICNAAASSSYSLMADDIP